MLRARPTAAPHSTVRPPCSPSRCCATKGGAAAYLACPAATEVQARLPPRMRSGGSRGHAVSAVPGSGAGGQWLSACPWPTYLLVHLACREVVERLTQILSELGMEPPGCAPGS